MAHCQAGETCVDGPLDMEGQRLTPQYHHRGKLQMQENYAEALLELWSITLCMRPLHNLSTQCTILGQNLWTDWNMARECPGMQRCLHITVEEAKAGWGICRPFFPRQSTTCYIQHLPASCMPLHSHLLFFPLSGEVYFFRDFSLQSWHLLKEWLDDLKSWYRWLFLCFLRQVEHKIFIIHGFNKWWNTGRLFFSLWNHESVSCSVMSDCMRPHGP